MAQLAIKGHPTRGKEVIEILEMLGGNNNISNYRGESKDLVYFINSDYYGFIGRDTESNIHSYNSYSLEDFLEKFPYKVGDKVKTIYDKIGIVKQLVWSNKDNAVRYELEDDVDSLYFANELQPYKEETMEEKIEAFEILESHCKDEVKIEFDPSKFEMVERENGYYVVRKKPKYPKTYEECCEIMDIDVSRTIEHDECPFYKNVTCYEYALLSSLVHFRKLRICRDAYWKIAGEEMGLCKPWEPDWSGFSDDSYPTITKCNDRIVKTSIYTHDCILVFPTEEIRDAFYENFKNLIEQCKELL